MWIGGSEEGEGGRVGMRGFFFKQKTAYEVHSGLVGSEMCIRKRNI